MRGDLAFVLRWSLVVVVALVVAVVMGRARLRPRITVRGPDKLPVAAHLELFELDRSPSAPSPTPRIGEAHSDDPDEVWIDTEIGPDGCLARVSAAGLGLGTGFIEHRGISSPVDLAPPIRVDGSVLAFGGIPIHDAEVQLLGGGPRGVPLVTVRTDADGRFRIDTVSPTVLVWHFRVFAEGYAIGDQDWYSDQKDVPPLVLYPTLPARGRLVTGEDIPLAGLAVRIFQLPGLATTTGPDGSFQFDAAPPAPMLLHPVVDGLPEDWTYERASMQAGRETVIRLVRGLHVTGRVVDGITGRPVARARVFHEHGPRCVVATRSDNDGNFDLPLVPIGRIEIRAVVDRQVNSGRQGTPVLAQAVETIDVADGAPLPSVLLRIE